MSKTCEEELADLTETVSLCYGYTRHTTLP